MLGRLENTAGKSLNQIGLDDIAFQSEELEQEQLENVNELAHPSDMTQEEPLAHPSDMTQEEPLADPSDMTQEEPLAHPSDMTLGQLLPEISELEHLPPLSAKRKKKKMNMPSLDSSSDEEVAPVKTCAGLRRKWTNLELSTLKSTFSEVLKDKVYPSGKNYRR